MKTCPFIAHLLGEEQSEILTIEHAASNAPSPKHEDDGGRNDSVAPHLLCLMESCRFYRHNEKTCAFDALFADLESMQDAISSCIAPDSTIAPRVTKDLNKFWKFQTKSVTELISHMSDLDQQQRDNLESIQDDLKQHLNTVLENRDEPTEQPDTDALQQLGTHIDQLQEQQRRMEEHLNTLAAGQAEFLDFFRADKTRREVEWLRSNKKEARTFNNLGVTSFHSGAFQTAKEQFVKAIELDPEFAEVYNNLGLVHTELGDEEKASEAFKRATELNPDMTAAYSNLGYLLHKQGSYEEAVEMYNEALGRSSKSSSAYTNMGNAYFKLGKPAEAEEAWEKALEIDPSNEKATLYLKQLRAEKR